jgi:hypothetical protein
MSTVLLLSCQTSGVRSVVRVRYHQTCIIQHLYTNSYDLESADQDFLIMPLVSSVRRLLGISLYLVF